MKFIKCPRCDLNYIHEDEKFCKVCLQEMKGSKQEEEVEMCSVCNAAPVLPGRDVCLSCLKEMNQDTGDQEGTDAAELVVDESNLSMDPVSNMDEMIPEEEEMDKENFEGMDEEISLELAREQEDEENEEDEEDGEQI